MSLLTHIRKDRYYLLLATQLLFILVLPFVEPGSKYAALIQSTGLSLILLAGSNIFYRKRWKKFTGFGVAILFVILTTLSNIEQLPSFYTGTFILFFALFIMILWEIVSMLIFTREIKMSLLAGALAGYLLMAICLLFFVITVSMFDPNTLSKPAAELGLPGLLYYCLITMTTIGYGDISPVNSFVQTASGIAGVASQFYMAVIVAVIVGKLMAKKN